MPKASLVEKPLRILCTAWRKIVLFFFLDGKAQIQVVVNLSARRRGHRFTAQISPNAENHQQPDAQVNHRIRAQTSAHSEDGRGHADRVRPRAAAQSADRIHHADRRRPSFRPHHVVQRGPDAHVVHPMRLALPGRNDDQGRCPPLERCRAFEDFLRKTTRSSSGAISTTHP